VVTNLSGTVLVYETIPPSDVDDFEALAWDGQIRLSWTNSPELDFAGVRILRKESGPPANAGDGELVYEGDDEEYVDTGLANGTTYFYSAFSYDYAPNYSSGVTANGTPEGHTIESVRYFPGNRKVKLFWDEGGRIRTTFTTPMTGRTRAYLITRDCYRTYRIRNTKLRNWIILLNTSSC